MTNNFTRRNVLKLTGAYGAAFAGLASSSVPGAGQVAEFQTVDQSPSAHGPRGVFRLINNATDRGSATVTLRQVATGRTVASYRLDTIGTNDPGVAGLSHEDRFPHVAADVTSFGDVPSGEYTLEVQYRDLIGKTTLQAGSSGFPAPLQVTAYVQPDGRIKVVPAYSTPALQVP